MYPTTPPAPRAAKLVDHDLMLNISGKRGWLGDSIIECQKKSKYRPVWYQHISWTPESRVRDNMSCLRIVAIFGLHSYLMFNQTYSETYQYLCLIFIIGILILTSFNLLLLKQCERCTWWFQVPGWRPPLLESTRRLRWSRGPPSLMIHWWTLDIILALYKTYFIDSSYISHHIL